MFQAIMALWQSTRTSQMLKMPLLGSNINHNNNDNMTITTVLLTQTRVLDPRHPHSLEHLLPREPWQTKINNYLFGLVKIHAVPELRLLPLADHQWVQKWIKPNRCKHWRKSRPEIQMSTQLISVPFIYSSLLRGMMNFTTDFDEWIPTAPCRLCNDCHACFSWRSSKRVTEYSAQPLFIIVMEVSCGFWCRGQCCRENCKMPGQCLLWEAALHISYINIYESIAFDGKKSSCRNNEKRLSFVHVAWCLLSANKPCWLSVVWSMKQVWHLNLPCPPVTQLLPGM